MDLSQSFLLASNNVLSSSSLVLSVNPKLIFTSLGLDCMLITSNSELNIEGIFTTSKNRIINLGLSGLATQNV